jgi:hypothetical protein
MHKIMQGFVDCVTSQGHFQVVIIFLNYQLQKYQHQNQYQGYMHH